MRLHQYAPKCLRSGHQARVTRQVPRSLHACTGVSPFPAFHGSENFSVGLKAPSRMSPSVLSRRSGSCFRRSPAVSSKRPETEFIAMRRRRTELLGQMLGRKWHMVAVIQITRQHVWKRPPTARVGHPNGSGILQFNSVNANCGGPLSQPSGAGALPPCSTRGQLGDP